MFSRLHGPKNEERMTQYWRSEESLSLCPSVVTKQNIFFQWAYVCSFKFGRMDQHVSWANLMLPRKPSSNTEHLMQLFKGQFRKGPSWSAGCMDVPGSWAKEYKLGNLHLAFSPNILQKQHARPKIKERTSKYPQRVPPELSNPTNTMQNLDRSSKSKQKLEGMGTIYYICSTKPSPPDLCARQTS